jgi:anti-anti-sigma regulatory factor
VGSTWNIMALSPLTYEIPHRFPIAVVYLRGVLTTAGVHHVRAAVAEALTPEPTSAIVDLSAVVGAEDRALAVWCELAAAARRWPAARLLLCSPAPAVAAALRRSGVARTLPVLATSADALALGAADPVPLRVYRRLAPTPGAPRAGRALAAYACRRWRVPGSTTVVEILVSELVGNAVRHARTPLDVTISLRDDLLRLSVLDGAARPPRMRTPTDLDDHGRGLLVVDAFAASWGTVPLGTGKVVWATVPVPAGSRQSTPGRRV